MPTALRQLSYFLTDCGFQHGGHECISACRPSFLGYFCMCHPQMSESHHCCITSEQQRTIAAHSSYQKEEVGATVDNGSPKLDDSRVGKCLLDAVHLVLAITKNIILKTTARVENFAHQVHCWPASLPLFRCTSGGIIRPHLTMWTSPEYSERGMFLANAHHRNKKHARAHT